MANMRLMELLAKVYQRYVVRLLHIILRYSFWVALGAMVILIASLWRLHWDSSTMRHTNMMRSDQIRPDKIRCLIKSIQVKSLDPSNSTQVQSIQLRWSDQIRQMRHDLLHYDQMRSNKLYSINQASPSLLSKHILLLNLIVVVRFLIQ